MALPSPRNLSNNSKISESVALTLPRNLSNNSKIDTPVFRCYIANFLVLSSD